MPDEHSTLRTVVMRYAGECTIDLSQPEHFDPILQRQSRESSWQPYDPATVRAQQDAFMDILRARGVEVLLADDGGGSYAQHYTRDLGFVIDDIFFVARIKSARRQGEVSGIRPITERMSRIAFLDTGTIEGGDVMLHDGCVLVGLSEETSLEGVDALRYRLGQVGIEREVIPTRFARPGVVHLDDLFTIVAPGVALIHLPAFPDRQRRWFEQRFDLIPVTDDEARAVKVNALALSPSEVIVAERSDRIAAELSARGITPIQVDYSEVTKIPGGFRCTTLPLVRARPAPS